jgi:hypothetical protein
VATNPPPAWVPSTLGGWLAALVLLVAVIVLILPLVGQAVTAPAWLVWLLIALLALVLTWRL